MGVNKINNEHDDGQFQIGLWLSYAKKYWKLLLVSVFVCVIIAMIHVYHANRIYMVTAKVLLKDDEKGTFISQSDMLADFGMQSTNSNVENEVEVINSKSVVQMAVQRAGLYTKYKLDGFFVDRPIYKNVCPVQPEILKQELEALKAPISITFVMNSDSLYEVSYKYNNEPEGYDIESTPVKITSDPYVLSTVKGDILLRANKDGAPLKQFTATIYPLTSMTSAYQGVLNVTPVSKTASVSVISLCDDVPENGVDFINSLIEAYNIQANEDKNILALRTKEFVSARIDVIGRELRQQEHNLAEYKKDNKLVSPSVDAEVVLHNENTYISKLENIEMELRQAEYLLSYIKNPENDMQAIPTVLGLSNEPTLSALISKYNLEVAKRNQLLATATEENPVVATVTDNVKVTRKDILEALDAINHSMKLRKATIEELVGKYAERTAKTPSVEREYADLTREQTIKSQLYVMLLQKYEENELALAVTADNLKCIDTASYIPTPVSPNKTRTLLFAILIGIVLPVIYIYIRIILATKIENIEDIEKHTSLPILGCVPLFKNKSDSQAIVVSEGKNDVMAEAFRRIRTNLEFVLPKKTDCGKIILFTSTISGEGKTFVSSNYAMSLALLGKKVIYVGLDIRCPRLAEVFGISKKLHGITDILANDKFDSETIDSLILPSGINDNLSILPAGVIPPNPSELLAKESLEKAMQYLIGKYDAVILDTAPVGLVADSLIASRIADAIIYVMRFNVTDKASVHFLNEMIEEGKLRNTSLILNAETETKQFGRYGKYRYGYSSYGKYGTNQD